MGLTASIIPGSNGQSAIQFTFPNGATKVFSQSQTQPQTSSQSNPQVASGTVFTDGSGDTATVTTNSSGSQVINVNQSGSSTPSVFTQSSTNNQLFTGPMGITASIIPGSSGQSAIQFTFPNGATKMFSQSQTQTQPQTSSQSNPQVASGTVFTDGTGDTATVTTNSSGTQVINLNQSGSSTPTTFTQSSTNTQLFTGPMGITAAIITDSNGQSSIQFTFPNGTTKVFSQSQQQTSTTSTQYYGSTGLTVQPSSYSLAYQEPFYGNDLYSNSTSLSGNSYKNQYYTSLPQGVSANQIPPGQEDLYILKSEVVPPVCPACPVSGACPRQEKCPPCPACARCPEPSFECKKVPNYNAINESYLPQPIVNDFSSFGM
jgi:4-diphosphocytidyl-2C-methyl-D-erythritol kinase